MHIVDALCPEYIPCGRLFVLPAALTQPISQCS